MTINQILIIISIVAFLFAGYLFKKTKASSIKEYTINEGGLNWFSVAAGISMTFAGGAAILNTASLGYSFKWYTLVDPIALTIGIFIVILFYNQYQSNKGITISSLLSGRDKNLSILIGIITSFVFILIVAAQFVALSKLISPYFPSINPLFITLIFSTIIFSYVFFGGFASVTRTDVLQLLFICAFLLAPILLFILGKEAPNDSTAHVDHTFSTMPMNYIILFCIPILFIPLSQDINIRIKSSSNKTNGILGLLFGAALYFSIVLAASYIGIHLGSNGVVLNDFSAHRN